MVASMLALLIPVIFYISDILKSYFMQKEIDHEI
jgi:hypothetical protein